MCARPPHRALCWPVPLPCLSPCLCSVWLEQPEPCVKSAWPCWEWWRLGFHSSVPPTPCPRAAAGPSRPSPFPVVTHGGCWVLRAPPVPSQPPGRGERRYRPRLRWPVGGGRGSGAGRAGGPGPICMCLRPPRRCCQIINPCHLLPGLCLVPHARLSRPSTLPACPAVPWAGRGLLARECSRWDGGTGRRCPGSRCSSKAPGSWWLPRGHRVPMGSVSQPAVGVEPCAAPTGMTEEPGGTE